MIERQWSADGIRADVRYPEGPVPETAIVIAHGFKGFKDWGFFPHLSESLAADGHAVVTMNFSHNGIGSDPLEFTELERFARNTLTRELDEVHRVLEALVEGEILAAPPRAIGVLGHSRGGGTAILAAAESEQVDALVTWAAVADFDRWDDETKVRWRKEGRIHVLNGRTGQQMPLDLSLLEDFEANRERLDIQAAAGRVEVPWRIIHGTEDPAVAVAEARALAQARPAATLDLVEGAGHTFEVGHPFGGPSPEYTRVVEATREHFRSALGAD